MLRGRINKTENQTTPATANVESAENTEEVLSEKKAPFSFGEKLMRTMRPSGYGNIQMKSSLEIGEAGDKYEQEADAVADKVMRMPEEKEKLMKQPEDSPVKISRKADSMGGTTAPEHVEQGISSSKGGGQSLPSSTQTELGNKMGADISGVKVHTDSNAVQMSQDIGAKAFTHGNDIYFNKGAYNPTSNEGKHLLAHELTHTVQQGGNIQPKIQREVIYSDNESETVYSELKNGYKEKESLHLGDLNRMEGATDVVFNINTNAENLGGNDGTGKYNSAESSADKVQIDILVRGDIDSNTTIVNKNKKAVLADELEHGRQFLDGELGFKIRDGESSTIGYDIQDEIKSQQASLDASLALEIPLNPLQIAFQNRESDQAFINTYYPAIRNRANPQSGSGNKTSDELKAYFDNPTANITEFVYRINGKLTVLKK